MAIPGGSVLGGCVQLQPLQIIEQLEVQICAGIQLLHVV
jgi:hypothetical protein